MVGWRIQGNSGRYLDGIQAQYKEMVVCLGMRGVRTAWMVVGRVGVLGPFEDSPYRVRELLIWGKERRSFDAQYALHA